MIQKRHFCKKIKDKRFDKYFFMIKGFHAYMDLINRF